MQLSHLAVGSLEPSKTGKWLVVECHTGGGWGQHHLRCLSQRVTCMKSKVSNRGSEKDWIPQVVLASWFYGRPPFPRVSWGITQCLIFGWMEGGFFRCFLFWVDSFLSRIFLTLLLPYQVCISWLFSCLASFFPYMGGDVFGWSFLGDDGFCLSSTLRVC